jgi:hypothetical protein
MWIHESWERTHVFADNLLDGSSHNFPGKDLDILFDIPRFGSWVSHDGPKEGIGGSLVLGHSLGSESFKVPSDPVLFLHTESSTNNSLE